MISVEFAKQSTMSLLNQLLSDYNNYLFDFDGVIVNSEPFKLKAYVAAFAELAGLHLDESNFGWMGKPELAVVNFWFTQFNLKPHSEQQIIQRKRIIYNDIISTQSLPLIPGVKKMLQLLHDSQKTIALVTSSDKHQVKTILEQNSLDSFFDLVVSKESTKRHKPHPEPYELALLTLNSSKQNTIVFEDSVSGVYAAKAAQLRVVGLGTTKSHEELETDWYIKDFDHLK